MLMSGHQPSYMPWLGFFDKIARADVFILHDVAQYERGGYLNRNRIKMSGGPGWIVVPVAKAPLATPISETRIQGMDGRWRRKQWTQILDAYGKTPFFDEYADRVRAVIDLPTDNLLEIARASIDLGTDVLDIQTPVLLASELGPLDGVRGDNVLSMAHAVGADAVLFGANGRDYVDEQRFHEEGVAVHFQSMPDIVYPQRFGEFVPRLSFLDLVFNCGPDSPAFLREAGVAR